MNETILVKLQGGLGNQIFQYAAALAVREAVNRRAKILCISAPNKHNLFQHNYVKDLFPEIQEMTGVEINNPCQYSQANAFERWNPTLLPSCSFLILIGYFQYLPAFSDVIPFLQEHFFSRLFKVCPNPIVLPNGAQSAFFHIRRGDYLEHPNYHWAQSIEYYRKGFEYVQRKNPYIYKWYVFSDDIEWCTQQEFFKNKNFEFIHSVDEYNSLSLMIQCKGGAVIANSTFSWWGAMLGAEYSKNPVVYPVKWCGEEQVILFPSNWYGI